MQRLRRREKTAPLGIKIICVLSALGVLIILLRSAIILLTGGGGSAVFIRLFFLALALGLTFDIYGLWTLQSWAWTWALVLFGADLLFNLLGIINGDVSGIAGALVSLLILGYIYSKRELYAQ